MNDQKRNTSIKNIIKAMDKKFKFIEEDIVKNRYLLLQLVKNMNQINKTLEDMVFDEIEELPDLDTSSVENEEISIALPEDIIDDLTHEIANNNFINKIVINNKKFDIVDALLFLNGQKEDLEELEELLEKHKDFFTPMIVGHS